MTTGHHSRTIRIQRAYDAPAEGGGYRVLVDRFWPRGKSKADLRLDEWAKDLAPTAELIKWFGHVPERWTEFRQRYLHELAAPDAKDAMRNLLDAAGARDILLLYGARDERHNQAVVLREALQRMEEQAKAK